MAEESGKIYSGGKVFVLTDSNVGPLYLAPLLEQLEKEGFGAGSLTLEAGEATKNIRSLPGIYAALLDAGLTRKDLLVTLGGGVIGDLGGFAASTLSLIHISFGLFCEGLDHFDRAYADGIINKVFTTNLVYRSPELKAREWYCEVDMSKYIALIIDTLNHDLSISELLNPVHRINNLLERYTCLLYTSRCV